MNKLDSTKKKFDHVELLNAIHKEWPVPDEGGTHGIQLPRKGEYGDKYILAYDLFIKIGDDYKWLPMLFEAQDLYKTIPELLQEIRDHVKKLQSQEECS